MMVRWLDGVGKDDGCEVASGWKADVPIEIVEHNHFKGKEIG